MGNWCFSPRNYPWSSFTLLLILRRPGFLGAHFGRVLYKQKTSAIFVATQPFPPNGLPPQPTNPSIQPNEPVFEAACSHQRVVVRLEQCMDHRYHLMVQNMLPTRAGIATLGESTWVFWVFFVNWRCFWGKTLNKGKKNTHEYLRRKR